MGSVPGSALTWMYSLPPHHQLERELTLILGLFP